MAILYVASEAFELKPLAERLTGVRPLKWPLAYAVEGIWEGRRVMLVANGAGPRLGYKAVEIAIRAVTAADLSSSRLEAVISVGLAGGLDPQLQVGDLVIPETVRDEGSGQTFTPIAIVADRDFRQSTLVTVEAVANTAADKQRLRSVAGAVDMEAAGVASRATRAGLPFSCVKVISDTADESFAIDFNRMRSSDGRISRVKIGLYATTHPRTVPLLFRLNARAKRCAEALGDFLVSCRFNLSENPAEPNNTMESA